jgi:hypothetical protein
VCLEVLVVELGTLWGISTALKNHTLAYNSWYLQVSRVRGGVYQSSRRVVPH